MESDASLLKKQLLFLAERRSMAEMERILSRFMEARLAGLEEDGCRRVEALLQQADADLLDWLSGHKEPPHGVDREVLRWIVPYCTQAHHP